MVIKNTKNTEKIEQERLATRERVRRYRERKKKGLTVTDSGFSVEKTEASVTLPPSAGLLTKTPLTLRTVFIGGRWLKILV